MKKKAPMVTVAVGTSNVLLNITATMWLGV